MIRLLAFALAAQPAPQGVVEAMFAAFNRHDPAAMARLYAPDARLTSSDFCHARGRADVERTFGGLFAAMPDLHDTIDTIHADGERVTIRFTATSAKAGMTLPFQSVVTVHGGRIVEDDTVFDTGGRPCEP